MALMNSSTQEIVKLISTFDWIVFSTVLVVTIISVFYGHHLKKKGEQNTPLEVLLMGRQLTLPMFIATLVATWYGGIFGVTAIAFEQGIFNFITQGFFWYLTYLLFAFFLVDKISRYRAFTLPDMVEKMFGPKSARLAAIFNLFNVLPIAYVISLGLFIQILFGLDFTMSMLIGIVVVLSYSLVGGFRAVVFSDLVQFFVMCAAVIFVLFFSVTTFGGIDFLKANLPKNHFSLTGNVGLANTLVWGFIALSTLVDPNFYQRCFAAKEPRVAKKGIIIATIIWFCFDICTTFGAMYARATMPDLDPNESYLIYAVKTLPEGLRGFILAGILATILSTLDSYLFLAGSTLSFDLWKKSESKKTIHYYKLNIIFSAIICFLMALIFEGNIKAVWKTLGSYSASCLLIPVLYGHLRPGKIKDGEFLFTSLFGVLCVTLWRTFSPWENIDAIYVGILVTSASLVFFSKSTLVKSKS
jgi:SSS family solute:Na+ symporter